MVKSDFPATVVAGETLTYTLVVANSGPSVAADVRVIDTLPDEVTLVTATPPQDSGPNPLIWFLGEMNVGEIRTFTVVVTVNPDVTGTISNTVSITTSSPDSNPDNNTDTEPTDVIAIADVSITKDAEPDPVAVVGENLTYTLTVYNAGPSDAQNVLVEDTLPAEVTFISTDVPLASEPNPLVWDLGTLGAGETRVIQVFVNINSDTTGTFSNDVVVGSTTLDPNPDNNDDFEDTLVETLADLAIVKTATPSPVQGGDILTYELVVTNNGPSDAQSVVVSDTLPAGVLFQTAVPGQDSGPNPLVWNLGVPAAGRCHNHYG